MLETDNENLVCLKTERFLEKFKVEKMKRFYSLLQRLEKFLTFGKSGTRVTSLLKEGKGEFFNFLGNDVLSLGK